MEDANTLEQTGLPTPWMDPIVAPMALTTRWLLDTARWQKAWIDAWWTPLILPSTVQWIEPWAAWCIWHNGTEQLA